MRRLGIKFLSSVLILLSNNRIRDSESGTGQEGQEGQAKKSNADDYVGESLTLSSEARIERRRIVFELPERVCGSGVEEAALNGNHYCLGAVVGLKLQEDLLHMHFDCVFSHKYEIGNFLVTLTL
jgi:hypothetical protein